jgi:DNA end-binding protein Ku
VPTTDEPIHKNEIRMALQLAQSMSEGYDLDAERDHYVQALTWLISAKAGGGEVEQGAEPAAVAVPTMDLMAALRESIAESQARRGETPAPAKKTEKKAPAKRAPRKAG